MKREKISSVSVIFPTYNEAGNIAELMRDCAREIRDFGVENIQLIVVDDDSPDETWRVAEKADCPGARIKIIRRRQNRALTASLNEGIEQADCDWVIWLDCDFSHPPEYIGQLLFMASQGFDVVVNSRYVVGGGEERSGKGTSLQYFLSKLLNWSLRFLLVPSFSDYTSGFVIARRSVFDSIRLCGDYGEYFVDFIFRAIFSRRLRVCELPFVSPARRSGESKTGRHFWDYLRRGRKYVATALRLRLRGMLSQV